MHGKNKNTAIFLAAIFRFRIPERFRRQPLQHKAKLRNTGIRGGKRKQPFPDFPVLLPGSDHLGQITQRMNRREPLHGPQIAAEPSQRLLLTGAPLAQRKQLVLRIPLLLKAAPEKKTLRMIHHGKQITAKNCSPAQLFRNDVIRTDQRQKIRCLFRKAGVFTFSSGSGRTALLQTVRDFFFVKDSKKSLHLGMGAHNDSTALALL